VAKNNTATLEKPSTTDVQEQEKVLDPELMEPPEEEEADDLNLPGIRQIGNVMAWFEAMLTTISGYVLLGAVAIGGIDTLTDGKLTSQGDWTIYLYGIAMASGVGGQLVGLSYRSSRAFGKGGWNIVGGFCFLALVAVLAYLEFITANAFAYHKAFGVPTIETIKSLGWTPQNFVSFRNGVAIGLIILSGFLRPKKKVRKSIAQMRYDAAQEAELDRINAEKRARKIAGWGDLAGQVGKATRTAVVTATANGTPTPAPSANGSKAPGGTGNSNRNGSLSGNGANNSPPPGGLQKPAPAYLPDDPAFAKYLLPNDLQLEDYNSISGMAEELGVTLSVLHGAIEAAHLPTEGPDADQPANVRNIYVYQVLALIEAGNLKPSAVRRVSVQR
jgi:hypothetical protein